MAYLSRNQHKLLSERTGIALYTRDKSLVEKIVVHYGDGETPKTEKREKELIKAYDNWHKTKGWGGLGYNLIVGPVTGNVYEGRGLDRVGAHATGHNTNSVGVCVVGGKDNLTPMAKKGLQEAYKIITEWRGKELPQVGHMDVGNTDCPGPELYAWVIAGGMATGTSLPSLIQPNQTLEVDGYFGPASTRRLQSLLCTPVDGYFSNQSINSKRYHDRMTTIRYGVGGSTAIKALQRKLNVVADGYFGPNTIRTLQSKLGVVADSYAGPLTIKAWQKKLNSGKVF